jgi:hypothetical protein
MCIVHDMMDEQRTWLAPLRAIILPFPWHYIMGDPWRQRWAERLQAPELRFCA